MINVVLEIEDIISLYEDEGIFENDKYVLMVSENNFYFRDKINNCVETIEYQDKINMIECINKAHEYGFYLK